MPACTLKSWAPPPEAASRSGTATVETAAQFANTSSSGRPRTQTQVAVSDDGHTWFLLNALPDLPVGDRYPVYVSQRCAGSLRGSEAQVGVVITGSSGKRLAYLPAVPAIGAQLLELLQGVDVVLFDGTFWSDDELLQVQGSGATAREMGHVPVFGPHGSLELLKHLKRPRKVLLHINNTNPMLNESGPEYRELTASGWRLAEDGWRLNL